MAVKLNKTAIFTMLLACAALTASLPANAQFSSFGAKKLTGMEYKDSYFSNMSISGFKLDMLELEAWEVINKDGWKGGWEKTPTPPATIETGTISFTRGDETIALYRYRRSDDDSIHVYTIDLTVSFDKKQDLQVLSKKLIEKYGPPTNAEVTQSQVLFQYSPDKTMRDNNLCRYGQQNKLKCAPYVSWLKGPKMTITIKPQSINIVLEDQSNALRHQANIEAKERIKNQAIDRDETKDLELNF